jgi:hypothetical protein
MTIPTRIWGPCETMFGVLPWQVLERLNVVVYGFLNLNYSLQEQNIVYRIFPGPS